MEQAQLTLEGMKRGVRDSDVFLLLATQNVLSRWFCQQELLTAIDEGTPIQLLVEEDPRFWATVGRNAGMVLTGAGYHEESRIEISQH